MKPIVVEDGEDDGAAEQENKIINEVRSSFFLSVLALMSLSLLCRSIKYGAYYTFFLILKRANNTYSCS